MQSLNKRLMILFRNILSGGLRDEQDIEMSRRIMIANALYIIGLVILIPMGFIGLAQDNRMLFFVDLVAAAFLFSGMICLRRFGFVEPAMKLTVIVCVAVFYYYLFVSGGVENTAFVWVYTFPLLACFALGSRIGGYASLVFFLFMLAFVFFDKQFPHVAIYTVNLKYG